MKTLSLHLCDRIYKELIKFKSADELDSQMKMIEAGAWKCHKKTGYSHLFDDADLILPTGAEEKADFLHHCAVFAVYQKYIPTRRAELQNL